MSKRSKLSEVDHLVADITIALCAIVSGRASLIDPTMTAVEKNGRCECITCFAKRFLSLSYLGETVRELRQAGHTGMSDRLRLCIERDILEVDWAPFEEELYIKERTRAILET